MTSPQEAPLAIEVCVESVAGVVAAARVGADRVELCSALSEGGLTPSAGLIQAARRVAGIDLFVLIRPRAGDFVYEEDELETMRADVAYARSAGADGVALGALTADGEVDLEHTRELIELARPMQVTFHRAFDLTRDPLAALDQLASLGVERVLSSGQEATAEQGLPLLGRMVEHAGERLSILPGCGVRPSNAARIVRESGAREVHFSAAREVDSPARWRNPRCRMGSQPPLPEHRRLAPDEDRIRAVLAALRS